MLRGPDRDFCRIWKLTVTVYDNCLIFIIYDKTGPEVADMKNEDELFREATLKICGNLEIDEALHELLLFLQEYLYKRANSLFCTRTVVISN